jgi:hypothetical protein
MTRISLGLKDDFANGTVFSGSRGFSLGKARIAISAPARRALRHDPLEVRKATLASIVAKTSPGIRFNEHIEGDGETVFRHACKLTLKALCQSARIPPTAPAARPIGSK